MATILASLNVQHKVTGTRTGSHEAESVHTYSTQRLDARFFVTPDDVPGAGALGLMEVSVSIPEPQQPFPEMTPEETRAWLVDILKKTM